MRRVYKDKRSRLIFSTGERGRAGDVTRLKNRHNYFIKTHIRELECSSFCSDYRYVLHAAELGRLTKGVFGENQL